ncbi:MAG TPA: YifB family Mg chelatase-like AAA ATPase [Opitutaceae bacterium]|jgi:magnesium chelatase family protein|nr:YifB family Mg chelatase-like AAA ATPase [Opitutaceae bacterium]
MLAAVTSAALVGIHAESVQVEVNSNEEGEPRLILVGLPDAAVRESCDRVMTALGNSGYDPLRTRTTINLAPGDLRKEGPMYDLPIALGLLAAAGEVDAKGLAPYLIAGELGLSGEARPIRGALAIARLANKLGKTGIILPSVSADEAALVPDVPVYRVDNLEQALEMVRGVRPLVRVERAGNGEKMPARGAGLDFADLKGQPALRRAIEVAVAGAHNLLIIGPPGSGKSMAAKRIAGIMPPPTQEEYLEVLCIQSIAGRTIRGPAWPRDQRPFRAPHHTVSDAALLGGGAIPGPGEISLAHHGVLFLDELPEFRRSVLQVLRQPLEDGEVSISRRAAKLTFPSQFMLVAAMNPCPCGYLGDPRHRCRCSPTMIERYRSRVGGPLLDRIDIHVEAPALSIGELRSAALGEASEAIRARVLAARAVQQLRYGHTSVTVNARMTHRQIREHCAISAAQADFLQSAMERLSLSARAYDRILKFARTIADLAAAPAIEDAHLLEAINYRTLDRAVF